MDTVKAERTEFWKNIALFCMGALLSGAVIFLREMPSRNDVDRLISAESATRATEDSQSYARQENAIQRLNSVEINLSSMQAKLDSLIQLVSIGNNGNIDKR